MTSLWAFVLEPSLTVCHLRGAMGHANTPPQLPEVTDEAGNTARWVPLLGAVLFLVSIGAIVVCHGGDEAKQGAAAEVAP